MPGGGKARLFFEKRYSGVQLTGNPDFVKLAEAHGAVGLRCGDRDKIVETLEQAMEVDDRPVMVDFVVSKEETITLVVQVNGKVRDKVQVPAGIGEEEAKKVALETPGARRHTEG